MTESTAGASPKKLGAPGDVEYLALEGGGLKGVVYLGAIRALEEMGVLPLPLDVEGTEALEEMGVLRPQARHKVRGISGASAGAFTALFLALGFDSSELAVILSDRETLKGLYDGPDNDSIREVHENKYRRTKASGNPIEKARRRKAEALRELKRGRRDSMRPITDRRISIRPIPVAQRASRIHDFPFADGDLSIATSALLGVGTVAAGALLRYPFISSSDNPVEGLGAFVESALQNPLSAMEDVGRLSMLALFVKSLSPGITGAVSEWIRTYLMGSLAQAATADPAYVDLVKQVACNQGTLEQYLYNVIFDRGVFPGFAIRSFLKERVVTFLSKRKEASDPGELSELADALTFADLERKTGTRLVVAAVNTTTHEPAYFGPQYTPDFPVIDAVAISGCFPLAFKPVLVTGCAQVADGFWMDGGIANNIPIHAFDTRVDGPLQPGMLGLRLEDLGERASVPRIPDPMLPAEVVDEGLFDLLTQHLASISDSVMYNSEAGQIRRTAPQLHAEKVNESSQTVLLNTHGLSTLEFAPPFDRSSPRIEEGFMAIVDYFGERGTRYSGAIEEFLGEFRALNPSAST